MLSYYAKYKDQYSKYQDNIREELEFRFDPQRRKD